MTQIVCLPGSHRATASAGWKAKTSPAAYALAEKLASAEGQSLGLSEATLEKRLYERGYLASVEKVTNAKGHEKTRLKVRRRIGLGRSSYSRTDISPGVSIACD